MKKYIKTKKEGRRRKNSESEGVGVTRGGD